MKKDEAAILDRKVGKIGLDLAVSKKPTNTDKLGASEMANAGKQDNMGSSTLLKQSLLQQQSIGGPKPPSCTSKMSTAIANAKTSSDVASEMDGTKDSLPFLHLKSGGIDKRQQNDTELMITPTAKGSKARKNAQTSKP